MRGKWFNAVRPAGRIHGAAVVVVNVDVKVNADVNATVDATALVAYSAHPKPSPCPLPRRGDPMSSDPRVVPDPDEEAWSAAAEALDRAADLLDAGRVDDSAREALQAASTLARVVGPDHPDHGNALATLGAALAASGDVRGAIDATRRALAVHDLWPGEESVAPLAAAARAQLGDLLMKSGAYAEAIRLAEEVRDDAVARCGPDSPEAARAWNSIGVCWKLQGRWADAREAYSQAEKAWERAGAPLPATLFHNLAGLACATDDFAAAEVHARAAVEARRGEGDPFALGTDLAGLGDALAGQGRLPEAVETYREAIQLLGSARPHHPEIAYALHNLGDALADLGKAREAEAAYRDSIQRKVRAFGEEDGEVAASRNNLAALLATAGRREEAKLLSRRAVRAARRLPAGHPVRSGCEALARELGVR
ncbi:tetratricopeptide repeat protein [Myxococcota bacterium]|nr:tetratricopeptide repeat protein [Myxococcota bacterium]